MTDDKLLDLHDYHVEAGDLTEDEEIDLDSIKELASEDDTDCFLFPDADSEFFELEYHLPSDQLDDGPHNLHDDVFLEVSTYSIHEYRLSWDEVLEWHLEDNSQDYYGLIHLFHENQELFDHYDENHIPFYDVAVEVYADGSSFLFPDADDPFFGIEPIELEIQPWVDRGRRYSRKASLLVHRAFQMIKQAKSSGFQVIPDSQLEDMESHLDRIWSYTYWVDEYHTKCEEYLRELVHVRRPVRHPLMLVSQTLYEQIGCLMSLAKDLRRQIRVEQTHKIQYPIWQKQCQDYIHHLRHPEEAVVEAGQLNAVVEAGQLNAVVEAGQLNAVEAGQLNAVETGELNAGQLNDADAPVDVGHAADE